MIQDHLCYVGFLGEQTIIDEERVGSIEDSYTQVIKGRECWVAVSVRARLIHPCTQRMGASPALSMSFNQSSLYKLFNGVSCGLLRFLCISGQARRCWSPFMM